MKKALAVAFGLFVLATPTPLSAAKPLPLEAPDPGRGMIGVRVKVIPPARIGFSYCDAVYFVRVVEDADRFGADDLIHSNYTDGRDVFLLNAKPGRFVAVGCTLAPKPGPIGPAAPVAPGLQVGLSFSAGAGTVMFAEADILQTEVEVRAKAVVFMGVIEAQSSTKTRDSDEAQAHYLQVVSPAAAHQGSMARAFSGHLVYTAAFKSIERGQATEKEFWDEAIEKRFTNELAWANRIAHGSSAPVVVATGSTSAGATTATARGTTDTIASEDEFLSAVCINANATKARANGQPKEAEKIARLVCQTVMTDWDSQGCGQNPDQDPCKKRLASLDGSLRSSGSSMLFAAAQAGQASICSVMLAMGSDPNAAISTGKTPVTIAAESGHPEIVEILAKASAEAPSKGVPGTVAAVPAHDADPVKELEAELEAGLVKLREVIQDAARLENGSEVSDGDVAALVRETSAELLSDDVPEETREQKIERLTRSRDLLLYVINDNASTSAEKYSQTPPPPVTVDTLREAINRTEGPSQPSGPGATALEDARTAMKSGDYATALHILPPIAERGDAVAQNMLGVLYLEGWGVGQDRAKALSLFRNSAEKGDMKGAYNLGRMYDNGWGLTRDFVQAVKWYRVSADQGYAVGQSVLGAMYATGNGVPQDYVEAMKWYRSAADQGEPEAQRRVGLMYAEGQGVSKDDAQAISWYRRAADQGNIGGQYWVGRFYLEGRGVEKNPDLAKEWLGKAAAQGNAEAQTLLKESQNAARPTANSDSEKVVPTGVPAGSTPSDDGFLAGACIEANAEKFRADGNKTADAKEMAGLVCRVVMKGWGSNGCRENPDQDACKQTLGVLDTELKTSGVSMLYGAAQAGRTDICSVMISSGSDPNAAISTSWTPVMIAAAENKPETVKLLLAKGANPNAKNSLGRTPVMFAAIYGYTEIVELLAKAGADLNVKPTDKEGGTALSAAASRGHAGTVAALLRLGAQADAVDADGSTALMKASVDGHVEAMRALLDGGADINEGLLVGTPLAMAGAEGHVDAVKLLLERGADVNRSYRSPDAGLEGITPLMVAAHEGQVEVVRILVAAGADLNARNSRGSTAVDLATIAGKEDVAEILRKAARP